MEIRFTVKHEIIVVFRSKVIWRFGGQIIMVNDKLTSAQMMVLMFQFLFYNSLCRFSSC